MKISMDHDMYTRWGKVNSPELQRLPEIQRDTIRLTGE
jgi:hypothetical protein